MYVLPLPVCPYAKMVPFMPARQDSTIGAAIASYTSDCVHDGGKTESKVAGTAPSIVTSPRAGSHDTTLRARGRALIDAKAVHKQRCILRCLPVCTLVCTHATDADADLHRLAALEMP